MHMQLIKFYCAGNDPFDVNLELTLSSIVALYTMVSPLGQIAINILKLAVTVLSASRPGNQCACIGDTAKYGPHA